MLFAMLLGPLSIPRAGPLAAQTVPPMGGEPLLGQPVVSVQVVEEPDRVIAENPPDLEVHSGAPLERAALRASIRRLYATGRYADITAEAAPVNGGLRVTFRVRNNFFIGNVRVAGLREPPSESQVLGALRLELGVTFRQKDLDAGLERARQLFRNNGFYSVVFDPVVKQHPENHLVDILLRVETGQRARLEAVGASNPTTLPTEELVRTSRLKVRQELTAARLEKGAERVRAWFFRRGYLGARVTATPGSFDSATNTVPVTLEVTAGSPTKVEVAGTKLSTGKLHQLIPIFQEGAVDEDLLAEGRRNLRDYYERQGYFNCDVQYSDSGSGGSGVRQITYTVRPGPRRRLVAVEFTGNQYFSTELLRGSISIRSAEFLHAAVFSSRLLEQNEDSLRALYLSNGFAAVKVRSETVEGYRGRADDLLVRFHIEEGEQTRIESLEITGNTAISRSELQRVIGAANGQPYSEATVATDRDNVLALYLNEGIYGTRFESRAAPGTAPNRVKLTYEISEGRAVTVSRILLDGNEYTRTEVILRQVLMKEGGPLREGDVITTQRNLYNLGIFNRVAVAPENPEGEESAKTMLVNVQEGKRFTLGYGAGIEVQPLNTTNNPTATTLNFAPRGILEFTYADFLGRPQTLQFRIRASTLQGRALAQYSAPRFLNHPSLNLQVIVFADKTRDIYTFTSTRYEGTLQLEERLSTATTLLYRYTYRKVLTSNLHIAPEEVPLFSQPTKVSGPGFAWVRDVRDNPANPTLGRFYTADVSLSSRALGSTASFVRLFFQNSTFTPLGHNLTFARSTRFGFETTFGSSVSTDIPLPERFFAGGGTSLRGFGLNQAGPRDLTTGFPVGGLAMLTSNQELRFPLRLPFTTAAVRGALFYDAGNVYSSVSDVTFRTTPPPTDLNFLSHSVGFGVQYPTPLGPIRVDLGYLLNSPQFTFCANTIATCPSATNPAILGRLHRFQFFLTLGSPF
jgi:outer membrane protein assembly complex protein YaeT